MLRPRGLGTLHTAFSIFSYRKEQFFQMPKVYDLIKKGYFLKELPPPFNTEIFADRLSYISSAWTPLFDSFNSKKQDKYARSSCVRFSYPKVGYSRRALSIPNPLHQFLLSETICQNWTSIEEIYSRSTIGKSIPIIDFQGRRAFKTKSSYRDFKEKAILNSYDCLYQVKTDISRYYTTIYTHIIPWLIDGKNKSRKKKNDMSLLGNLLDRSVRNTQSGQTMGIPIGPDTSLVISELVACKMDEIFCEGAKKIKGARFYDDYILYFKSSVEAEETLKNLQRILADYCLDINEEKTFIEVFPVEFDFLNSWSVYLSRFEFREGIGKQRTDLLSYFSMAFDFAQKNSKDTVLKYAVERIKGLKIFPENWDVFESLLLRAGLIEPSVLPVVVRKLITNRELVSKSRVREVAITIILEHYFKGHTFEISWALWLLRSFDIKVDSIFLQKVIDRIDPISSLIVLDLQQSRLINGSLDFSSLKAELNAGSLFREKWLLVYESIKKDWLTPPDKSLVQTNHYFEILHEFDVEFYDSKRQLPLIKEEDSGAGGEELANKMDDLKSYKDRKAFMGWVNPGYL